MKHPSFACCKAVFILIPINVYDILCSHIYNWETTTTCKVYCKASADRIGTSMGTLFINIQQYLLTAFNTLHISSRTSSSILCDQIIILNLISITSYFCLICYKKKVQMQFMCCLEELNVLIDFTFVNSSHIIGSI